MGYLETLDGGRFGEAHDLRLEAPNVFKRGFTCCQQRDRDFLAEMPMPSSGFSQRMCFPEAMAWPTSKPKYVKRWPPGVIDTWARGEVLINLEKAYLCFMVPP